eukprot:TRINITY_DN898_c0_g2_i1.p1 TRINITY_DN898_c0_g2~~TRINITY_DN898_c0_g2_i1.p1  ORF type:complete len:152 (+),score=40.43 TRINITY_DN898_c0_g2_i1:106-561(+)
MTSKTSWTGSTVKDVPAQAFITAYALHLKRSGQITVPKWADIVKTGCNKELAPYDPDWFYVRTAAIARKLYLRPGLGVGSLKRIYGGAKRRGPQPSTFQTASGSVIRAAVHELEKIKILEKNTSGGRKISVQGQKDLDRIAHTITVTPKSI